MNKTIIKKSIDLEIAAPLLLGHNWPSNKLLCCVVLHEVLLPYHNTINNSSIGNLNLQSIQSKWLI